MKKIFSIILSAIMAFSACTITALTASAAEVVSPGGETTVIEIGTTVNGNKTSEITYVKNPNNSYEITFTYTGDGILEGWTFIPENVTVVSKDGNSITILVNAATTEVIANAIVKHPTPEPEVPTEPTKPESTSPSTGSVALTGLAVTGAGIAALSLLKKKNDAE